MNNHMKNPITHNKYMDKSVVAINKYMINLFRG